MSLSTSYLRRQEDDYQEHGAARLLLCGKAFQADPTGALFWPAEQTLCFADLRLGKGCYLSEEQVLLPPYDTSSAFDKLEEAIDRYNPQRVLAIGESFSSAEPLDPHDLYWLQDLMEGREWFWAAPQGSPAPPEGVGGAVSQHVTLAGVKFRHEPVKAPVSQEISGGMHPVACVMEHDYAIRGRCFVSNGMRLVLPSSGIYGQGANVLDEAFDPLLGRNGLFVWVISGGRVRQVASGQLRAN